MVAAINFRGRSIDETATKTVSSVLSLHPGISAWPLLICKDEVVALSAVVMLM